MEERFGLIDQSLYGNFDAQLLNQSINMINDTINNGNASTGLGYMFATLRAYNATKSTVSPTPTAKNGSGRGKKTSMAMCVSRILLIWHQLIL